MVNVKFKLVASQAKSIYLYKNVRSKLLKWPILLLIYFKNFIKIQLCLTVVILSFISTDSYL